MNAVAGLSPDVLVVDTFPGGSFGELLPVLETVPTRVLVARAVKDEIAADDAYRALLPLYHKLIVPDERGVGPILLREREELLPRDDARRRSASRRERAVYITLGGGGDEAAARTLPLLTDEAGRARLARRRRRGPAVHRTRAARARTSRGWIATSRSS